MRFEDIFMGIFDGIVSLNFNIIFSIVLLSIVVFWFFVTAWVFLDAKDRTYSRETILFYTFLVLVFNIPGLLIYLIIRPKTTLEEQYWADLEKRYLLYETAELYDCPKCAFPLQTGFLNCPNCGEVIKTKCSECGANIDRYWKYCSKCGVKNSYVRDTIVTSQTIQKERKLEKSIKDSFVNNILKRFNTIKDSMTLKIEKITENNRIKRELAKEINKKKKLEQANKSVKKNKNHKKKNKKK